MSAEQFFDTITFIGCEKKNFFGALFLFIIIMLGRLSSNQNIARHGTKILRFWNGQSRSVSTDSLSVWRRERDLRGLAKFKISQTRMQVLKLVHSFGFVFFPFVAVVFFFCSTVCAEDDAELT